MAGRKINKVDLVNFIMGIFNCDFNLDELNQLDSLIAYPLFCDSDDLLFMITEIEDYFNLEFAVDDLKNHDITRIDGILDLINNLKKEGYKYEGAIEG